MSSQNPAFFSLIAVKNNPTSQFGPPERSSVMSGSGEKILKPKSLQLWLLCLTLNVKADHLNCVYHVYTDTDLNLYFQYKRKRAKSPHQFLLNLTLYIFTKLITSIKIPRNTIICQKIKEFHFPLTHRKAR